MNLLCYGDSNTWGHDPTQGGRRFDHGVRWTSLLAGMLGGDWHLYEAGLCGRTAVFPDPFDPEMCGRDTLSVCVRSHRPLDVVILMLGTNDLKHCFHATAEEISRGAEGLVQLIRRLPPEDSGEPDILLVSPILVGENIEETCFAEMFGGLHARRVSQQLAGYYRQVAQRCGCHFLNAAEFAQPSREDAIHLDAAGHRALAAALREKVLEIGRIRASRQQAAAERRG